MPGETISFKVTALDQAGNQQPAVWSITENNENESDKQVAAIFCRFIAACIKFMPFHPLLVRWLYFTNFMNTHMFMCMLCRLTNFFPCQ